MNDSLSANRNELMNVVIRADAGPVIGTGHVMRMMALGDACGKLGARVTMLCGDLPSGLVQRLLGCGIDVHLLQSPACDSMDARETLEFAKRESADWIVLDGYRFDRRYQETVAKCNAQLMMMDDGELAHEDVVDVVLNQNAYARSPENAANRLAGCQYTLLRSEFLSEAACEPKVIRKMARRILLTMGGCDDANWTQRVLKTLHKVGSDRLIVDVVVGAGYRNLESLLSMKKDIPFSIRIHRNVDRMVDLMQKVDLAITAGGSTCYELARCGVPAIAIPVADNQIPIVEELQRLGTLVGYDAAHFADLNDDHLKSMIKKLIRDHEQRQEMSAIGRSLVDGQGAFRIARRMANSGLRLRPATIDDAPQLLAWRNDPEVRSVSFENNVVSLSTYQLWLQRKLDQDDCSLWIAVNRSGESIGQVRLEELGSNEATIRISLDQVRRAKGLGRSLIEKACGLAFEQNPQLLSIVAQILPGNVASERAFRSVGFVQSQPAMIDKKLAFQFVLHRESMCGKRRAVA